MPVRSQKPFDLSAAISAEAALDPNCFTIGRFTPAEEGIALVVPPKPLYPYMEVGEERIMRDQRIGCLYMVTELGRAMIRRAFAERTQQQPSCRRFYALKNPGKEELNLSLLRISLGLPLGEPVVMHERLLRPYYGVRGGFIVAKSKTEVLITLKDGESINLFFVDGNVRTFHQNGAKLEEKSITHKLMFKLRIIEALNQLERASKITDVDLHNKHIRTTLSGMSDLLHITARFKGVGQELRRQLIRDFFLQLPDEKLGLIHKRIFATLMTVDSALVSMLRKGSKEHIREGERIPAWAV